MKVSAVHNLKFKKLKRRLGVAHHVVVGVLESIWHIGAAHFHDGAIGKMSDEDIAAEIEWRGEPSELIAALVESGWLDSCPINRVVIHDWAEHCPNYVKGVMAKHGKKFAISSTVPEQDEQGALSRVPRAGCPEQGALSMVPPIPIPKPIPNQTKKNPPLPPLGDVDPIPAESIKRPYDPQKAELPPELDSPEFRKAWGEWFIYRRESKQKPYKQSTINRKLSEFIEIGQARAIAAIGHSISQGYIGIFEPKAPGAAGGQGRPQAERKIHRAIDGLEPELRAKLESQAAADAARGMKPFDSLRKPAKPLYTPEETERFMAEGRARAAKMAAFNAQLTQKILGNMSNNSDGMAIAVTKSGLICDKTPKMPGQSTETEKPDSGPISDELPF